MFFAPTLRALQKTNCSIYVLCVSSGDEAGLGVTRRREMREAVQALGIPSGNLTILDYDDFPDGFVRWDKEKLAHHLLEFMEKLDCDFVLTFDESGVSGHPNHSSCFSAMQFLYSNGLVPADVQIFVLETVPIWRKYVFSLDVIPSFFHSTFMYVSDLRSLLTVYSAIRHHRSQLVWFRYLYLLFSRYVLINTLKRIPLHKYYVSKKGN
ncbi:hypothetical protein L596_007210 [Steinernema carpocapsae]|uniref:N-acetylglucosaminylphosphatidylinositol deacetylase n=1 Tax=Steinernema carpocapsae TaxID=34508 RepID=A0A4U5P9A5_STECR|nr:hypothetical protein L596_007210 [Steinernema carpocapsae]